MLGRLDPFRTLGDLLRWDPFADIDLLPRTGETMFMPDIELKETPDNLVLKADLPGMSENEIDVSVTGNRLTINGRRVEEDRQEDEQYFAYERRYGSFSRSFTLPETYEAERVQAELRNGVLTVTVPKRPGAQAKHIPLTTGSTETQRIGVGEGGGAQARGAGSTATKEAGDGGGASRAA